MQIWALNPYMQDPTGPLLEGQLVAIGRVRSTQPGDTVDSLSVRLGVGLNAVAALNADSAELPAGSLGVGQDLCFLQTSCGSSI